MRDAGSSGRRRRSARSGRAERAFLAPVVTDVRPGPPPTFSVVVAAYQAADVVGDALESIRSQTLQPLEVIVCDDGSTDDLDGALEPYRDEIVLLRKENGGEGSAKNAAARAARGEFVVVLDADDVYLPRRLEALSRLAQARPDLDILTTDGFIVANGRTVRRAYDRTWRFETVEQRRAILQRNFVFGLAAVRRSRLLEHGGFDESILWTTDWDLWLRLILDGSRAGCVDEPLALYRLRETSLTARRRDLLLGKLTTLEKARQNPDLMESERPTLEASLTAYRRELDLMDLRAAAAAGEPSTRGRALELLRAGDVRLRSRLQVAALAAAPGVAGRVLRKRERSAWTGAAGIRVPRKADRTADRGATTSSPDP
ncbi:MAG TPA: glycosyltransferase family A protein [Gaiellaceae bacterium]|nr:glycosyltransferase family A protein [Gaiellaceae bacterium]